MSRVLLTIAMALFPAIPTDAEEIALKQKLTLGDKEVSLEFVADTGTHKDMKPLAVRMGKAYFNHYPKVFAWLGVSAMGTPKKTIVEFKDDLKHPARTVGNRIEMNVQHLRRNPGDTEGLFIHELAHVIQSYKPGAPTWFTEGSADYVRFKTFPTSSWAQSSRKDQTDKEQPFGHYWKSAAFLLWMEETHCKTIVREISAHCRNGTYQPSLWKELTEHDLQALAGQYRESVWQPPLK